MNIPDLKKLIIPIIAKKQNDVAQCLRVLNEKISNNDKIANELDSIAKQFMIIGSYSLNFQMEMESLINLLVGKWFGMMS